MSFFPALSSGRERKCDTLESLYIVSLKLRDNIWQSHSMNVRHYITEQTRNYGNLNITRDNESERTRS